MWPIDLHCKWPKQKRIESIYSARKKAVYMKLYFFFVQCRLQNFLSFFFHLFLVCIIIVVGVHSFDPDLSVRHYNNVWNTWQHTPRINWKIKLVYRRISAFFLPARSPLFMVRWVLVVVYLVCVCVRGSHRCANNKLKTTIEYPLPYSF